MTKLDMSTRPNAPGSPDDIDESLLEVGVKLDVLDDIEGVETFFFAIISGVSRGGGILTWLASDLNAACREDSVCLICSGTRCSRIQA